MRTTGLVKHFLHCFCDALRWGKAAPVWDSPDNNHTNPADLVECHVCRILSKTWQVTTEPQRKGGFQCCFTFHSTCLNSVEQLQRLCSWMEMPRRCRYAARRGVGDGVYVGSMPTPVWMFLRTMNNASLGELGTCGTFMRSCDGRLFNEQNKLGFSGLLMFLILFMLLFGSKFTFKICLLIKSAMLIAWMFTEICVKGLGERKSKLNLPAVKC